MNQTELLNSINAKLATFVPTVDDLKERMTAMESGRFGKADEAALETKIKATIGEVLALQNQYNQNYGVPVGRPPVDTDGNILPEVERQLGFRNLFGKFGTNVLPYEKMVGDFSHRSRWLKAKNTHELDLFQELQDSHDAVAFIKRHIWTKYRDEAESVRMQKFVNHPDVKNHVRLRVAAGYLDPSQVNLKANEIMNPNSLSSLDFTFLSGNLLMFLELAMDLDQEFQQFTMPREQTNVNIQTNHAIGFQGGTAATHPPVQDQSGSTMPHAPTSMMSQLAFSLVSFSAKYNMAILPFNDQLEEDSVIPVLPKMREEVVYALRRSRCRAIIDGDVQTTHQDHHANNTVAAPDYRKAFNGLRRLGLTNVGVDFSNTFTTALLDSMLVKHGVYAENPADSIFIMSQTSFTKLVLTDQLSQFQLFGGGNTLPTGTVGLFRGRRIRTSSWVRENLNASGVYDDTTTTRGTIVLANTRRFYVGAMRAVLAESWRIPTALVTYMVAHIREDFQAADTQDKVGASPTGIFAGPKGPVVVGFNVLTK